MAFTLSVAKVTFMASSSKASEALKLKKSDTLEPNSVAGSLALPPKYKRPSWKVHVLGQPRVLDQQSSYPASSSHDPLAIAVSAFAKGTSVMTLTTVLLTNS